MTESKLSTRQELLAGLFNNQAPIALSMGMKLHYNEEGQACFTMPYNPNFDHALKGIHGGVIATMIDNAGWFTVAPHFDAWIATVEFNVKLLEPVAGEEINSMGSIVRLGKRLATADMEVHSSSGKLIAKGSGTFTLTKVPLGF